jgi:phage protein D
LPPSDLPAAGFPGAAFGAPRRPALRVLANGSPLAGAIDAEVISSNYYSADRYAVSVALSADPAVGAAWFAATPDMLIEVQMGLFADPGSGGWQSLIMGAVDLATIDPINEVVRLEGRDLTALLIQARTQETFANQTASEIATTLAARHGLAARVMPTTTPVGRYYQLEHDRTTFDQFSSATTEWDLLVFLARHFSP